MGKPKSVRKPRSVAEPHLKLVPPPKPKRRKRPWWFKKIGRIRKPDYGTVPELLKFEEEVVLRVVTEHGESVSVNSLMAAYPERFHRKQLWWTLCRLVRDEKLYTAHGLKPRQTSDPRSWGYWRRYACHPTRHFWAPTTQQGKR